jgi:hypothetical protein
MKKQTTFNQDVSFHATINASDVNASMVTAPSLYTDSVFFDETNRSHGETGQRGQMRYDASRNMYQVYSGNVNSAIWSGLAAYKTEQPPALRDISFTNTNTSVTVTWKEFPEVYRDALDGTSYPVYMFTVLDVSYSGISGESSTGWETIFVGNGNKTTADLSFEFNEGGTSTSIAADYDVIQFISKPNVYDKAFPAFTQDHSFNVRVYGVNYSRQQPNYVEISGVCLQPTGPPGKVEITSMIESQFGISMDVSFDLDSDTSGHQTDTATIPIESYEISYNLVESKRFDTDTVTTTDSSAVVIAHDSIDGVSLPNLYPGAKYDIQIKAKNTMNGLFGEFSDVSQSEFTHVADNPTQYVTTDELNDVSPTGMTFVLENSLSQQCRIRNGSSTEPRNIMNSNGTIKTSEDSTFYLNYGYQGVHRNNASVVVNFSKTGYNPDTVTLTYDGSSNPGFTSFLDCSFGTNDVYIDAGNSFKNKGFVSIGKLQFNGTINLLKSRFSSSNTPYNISYTISGDGIADGVDTSGDDTGDFYVDDYSSQPDISINTIPSISVDDSTVSRLFGIPSVQKINLDYDISVSNFADDVIPYKYYNINNLSHLTIDSVTNEVFTFDAVYEKTSSIDEFVVQHNDSKDITSGYYRIHDTSCLFNLRLPYLNHSSAMPAIFDASYSQDLSLNGTIFQDSSTNYTGVPIHIFNGHDDVSSTPIDVSSVNFVTDYSSDISHMLFYFDGKFVSGGYQNGDDISPFINWSSNGFATNAQGQDYSVYSDTSYNGYKWIALDVSSHVIPDGGYDKLDLANFDINGTHYKDTVFGTDYVAYIYQDGKFGSLVGLKDSITNWWSAENGYNITNVDAEEYISNARTSDYHGYLNSAWNGSAGSNYIKPLYLVVGLPQNSALNFTFS